MNNNGILLEYVHNKGCVKLYERIIDSFGSFFHDREI